MASDSNSDAPKSNGNWDSYWSGAGGAAAFSADGADHPALVGFWKEIFEMAGRDKPAPRIIDLASGNGAVIAHALDVFAEGAANITSVDLSEQAVTRIRERFPGVTGVVADAAQVPLESDSYDVVTSQFGIEYAGAQAVDEALRLLAPGGYFAALLHHTGSAIHRDCVAGLDAVRRLQDADFFPLAIDFFSAGFDALGGGDREPYDAAATRFNPAVKGVEAIFNDHGQDVAGGAIAQLYRDVSRMHQRIAQYDRDEVLRWLQQMSEQLTSYSGRMASMVAAAVEPGEFEKICDKIQQAGLETGQGGPLHAPDEAAPLAWALVVRS
ncbi:MAG: class I SAM-dependent methyltransferase [Woeseiaceae bacterium]|nr:class I SAM-dependent methyltransferase [Woeseiaceae bacterium]